MKEKMRKKRHAYVRGFLHLRERANGRMSLCVKERETKDFVREKGRKKMYVNVRE